MVTILWTTVATLIAVACIGDIVYMELSEAWWNFRQYVAPKLNYAKKRRPPRRHWKFY